MTLKDVTLKTINGLKKTFVYTSDREKAFIEGVLNIHARTEKKTPSAILEDLIAKAVLPANETASRICRQLYSSDVNNVGALMSVFDIYSAGFGDFKARYDNGIELVNFFHSILVSATYPIDDINKGNREYFISNFEMIVQKIENDLSTDHEDSLNVTQSPVKYAKFLLDEAKNKPQYFKPINFTQLLKDHWDLLGNYTYTYRALVALCKLIEDQISDYAEDRVNLVRVISDLSKNWD